MENISGLIRIDLIPVERITNLVINPATSKIIVIEPLPPTLNSPLSTLHSWSFLYFTPKTASVQTTSKHTDHGTIFTCTIKLRTPRENPETTTFIRAAQGCWFLIRVEDGNGTARLIGTRDFPAQLNARIAVPAEPSGYNGYEITFTSNQLTPPAFFS